MDPVTHVAAGVVCSQFITSPSRWWAALAGVLFALLPDVDYFFIFWDRLSFIRYHRGFTHSILALTLFALAGASIGRVLAGSRWFKPLFLLGLTVLASHLLLDLATSYGTQILNPFSRRRFTLDWIFIIDPYLTALLAAGAISSLAFYFWGPRLGAFFLFLAILYVLICGFYHHRAFTLARQIFQNPVLQEQNMAALPQPFSCRRWQLISATPLKTRQTFVQLPVASVFSEKIAIGQTETIVVSRGKVNMVPAVEYQDPDHITIQTWAPFSDASAYPQKTNQVLSSYLEFARFPLFWRACFKDGEQLLEWLDLRFSVPGRAFPFVLQMRLDSQGRLLHWLIGRRG